MLRYRHVATNWRLLISKLRVLLAASPTASFRNQHPLGRSQQCVLYWVAVLIALLPCSSLGQSATGRLCGIVAGSGQAAARVRVSLSQNGAPKSTSQTTTDAQGRFCFLGLAPGFYSIDLAVEGWQQLHISPINVRAESAVYIRTTVLQQVSGQAQVRNRLMDEGVWFGTEFGNVIIDEFPIGRNIWSLLQSLEPSTVTNPLQIGGVETAIPALFGALGASWTENQYRLNGLDVTDPYVPGLPLINPDCDALSGFQLVTASKPVTSQASGQTVSLTTPMSNGELHGTVRLFGSGRGLESDNMNARLREADFLGPERLNSLIDASAQLGGKLPTALLSIPFFGALSRQRISQDLGGFAAQIDSGVDRVLVDFAPWSYASGRLNLLYGGQHAFNSDQGAMPTVAPSATTRGDYNFNQFQALWNQSLNPTTLLSASVGVVNANVSSRLQEHVSGISAVDLPLMIFTGSAPLATSGLRTRYEAQGAFEFLRNSPLGTHNLSLGFDWSHSNVVSRWYAISNSQQTQVNGIGNELILWNTPTRAKQHIQNIAEYVEDSWRPFERLSLPVGLRVDTSTGRASEAANPISWTILQPRVGFVATLWPPGLLLQGSWSRYGHLLQGRYFDFGNPAALGAEVFRWHDLNGDGIAQSQEIGALLRRLGGPFSAIDPRIVRPYTNEITFGLEQNISNRLTASLRFFRRDDHRLIGLENLGVPFSSYLPVPYSDPGNDGILGTGDDQILTLYNEKPSALGHDFLLLTNSGQSASYKGFEAFVQVNFLKSLQVSAAFTAGRTLATTSPGNSPFQNDTGFVGTLGINPNTLVMSRGRTFFDRAYTGRILASYTLPHAFYLAAIATYFDGAPFGRLLFVNGFNQGPFFVRATPVGHPGGFQTQFNSAFDCRLAREFELNRGVLSVYVDVFNMLNVNSNTREGNLTGPVFLQRIPLAVEAPRTIRLGLAWNF